MMAWRRVACEMLAVGGAYCVATFRLRTRPRWGASFMSGSLLALVTHPLVGSLRLSPAGLGVALWLLFFVVGFLLSMIEAVVFTEGPSSIGMRDVGGAAVISAVAAVVAALVMKPASPGSVVENLRRWVEAFGWTECALRVVLMAVAFMVAYNVIGSLTWPFVRPYYTDPKHGLRLRIPRAGVIIPLQVGRGLIAAIALAPLIASSTTQGMTWWGQFSLALAVTAGVVPLLNAVAWPIYLRVAQGVEIVVFSVVHAFALWRILAA